MAFTPNSAVYLIDTVLDNNYKNQLQFDNVAEQQSYFQSKVKHSYDNITYLRKTDTIKVNANIDSLWDSNYVMYRNENFSTKWFYAFIIKMEYISDNVTEIYIETDVYQTWLFEAEIKTSFVLREHVADDSIGINVVDEKLEIGDYQVQSKEHTEVLSDLSFVMAVSDSSPLLIADETVGMMYGNVYSGLYYFAVHSDNWEQLKSYIELYTADSKADAIQYIFSIPSFLINNNELELPSGRVVPTYPISFVKDTYYQDVNSYVPKNNKLFVYPYNVLYVSNNQGGSSEYRIEDFNTFNLSVNFTLMGNVSPSPVVMLVPNGYKGLVGDNMEYGLAMSGFPLCSWNNDTYSAWLVQNGMSTAVGTIASAGALIGGIATANPVAIMGGAMGVFSQMNELYHASLRPNQTSGNTNNGSLNVANNKQEFYFQHMNIRKDYAKRIDDFFSMYGYKVNALKVPELYSRTNWNYVQTIDVNIEGSIPDMDMRKLKEMYNNGVTFWHSHTTFLNYALSNNIRG